MCCTGEQREASTGKENMLPTTATATRMAATASFFTELSEWLMSESHLGYAQFFRPTAPPSGTA